MRELAAQNQVFTSLIGQGYSGTILPAVIQRNILENPAWYTAYTPYQPEISQGRLEALFNFQTMICDLTGLDVANASLLDEATAAAEAMALARARARRRKTKSFFVDAEVHPQTLAVLRTRAEPLGWNLIVGDPLTRSRQRRGVRRPAAISGHIGRGARPAPGDRRRCTPRARSPSSPPTSLALTLLASPGELGADIAIGSAQRFGVPMGYGGPHAAYMAVRDALKRVAAGPHRRPVDRFARAAGLSAGAADPRAAHPPRESDLQHLHRAGAAGRHRLDVRGLSRAGGSDPHRAHGASPHRRAGGGTAPAWVRAAVGRVFRHRDGEAGDKQQAKSSPARAREDQPAASVRARSASRSTRPRRRPSSKRSGAPSAASWPTPSVEAGTAEALPADLKRASAFLTHPVFHAHRSETELLRYMRKLATAISRSTAR